MEFLGVTSTEGRSYTPDVLARVIDSADDAGVTAPLVPMLSDLPFQGL